MAQPRSSSLFLANLLYWASLDHFWTRVEKLGMPWLTASLTTCWLCHHHHIPYFFQKLTLSTFCSCRPISRHLRAPLVIEEPRGRTGCFPAKVLGWGRPALNCPKKLRPADGEYRSLLPRCLPCPAARTQLHTRGSRGPLGRGSCKGDNKA